MNRAARRQAAKKKIDHKDIRAIEIQASNRAIDYVVERYTAAVALACKDKLGFGKVRTQRFLGEVRKIFDAIESEHLSIEDVLKTVKDELGIEVRE